jgi:hypothetical protein
MAHWKDYKEDWILFLESGFIAVNHADEDSAIKLFKAAELLNPDSILPKVGMGYLHLHKLELKQACDLFEEVLAKDPKNEMAKSFLGICMSLIPTSLDKGEKILEQLHKSNDPMIKRLSETAIDFAEKFLKKAPTPAQGQKKGK